MSLSISKHPVAAHLLTTLRDRSTGGPQFRAAARAISRLLAIEAMADLAVKQTITETPMEVATGSVLAQGVVLAPILRAGLGMLEGAQDLIPDACVGYLGIERDETTAVARSYYTKLPTVVGKCVVILDPMLATGGSAACAIRQIAAAGAADIRLVCVVAAPVGVAVLEEAHPGLRIFTAALDRQLDERKYILPGLGDFGDRLCGTC